MKSRTNRVVMPQGGERKLLALFLDLVPIPYLSQASFNEAMISVICVSFTNSSSRSSALRKFLTKAV